MPELPEVETTCRGIKPSILKSKVTDVIIRKHQLRWPIPKDLPKQIIGKKVINVLRRGKYLLIFFTNGTIIMHLGMSGRLCIVDSKIEPEKHSHVDIYFGKNKVLRYTDPRRFGAILWTSDNPYQHKLLCKLGPEPLEEEFSAEYLHNAALKKTQAVKQFIMDANVVVGVGNIYANEALYKAKINPNTPAKNIPLKSYKKLVKAIKDILAVAITKGGTTLKDFLGSDGKPGYFVQSLLVYGRGGEQCTKCKHTLTESRLGQRTTVYCEECQPELI